MSLTRIGSIGINTGIAFAGVTTIVTLNTANDALSIGATVNVGSGITLGASGDIFATGVSTVTTLKVGSGVTVSSDGDIFATGVCTATSFSGSGANLTGIDTDLVSDTSPQLGGNLDVNTKNIVFGDSGSASDDRLTFGAGTDLSVYHDGTDSFIDNSTGGLKILGDTIRLKGKSVDENMLVASANGAVELYYDNSKIFETGTDQATITGKLTINRSSNDEKLILSGSTSPYIRFQESTTNKAYMQWSSNGYIEIYNSETSKGMRVGGQGVEVLDDIKFTAGDSQDLQIYHDGSNSYVNNTGTGLLILQGNGSSDVSIRAVNGESGVVVKPNAAVELYYDNTVHLATDANGIHVTTNVHLPDSGVLELGDGSDLKLYHTAGSANFIQASGGHANIHISNLHQLKNQDNDEFMLTATNGGAVDLYHNNSLKLETTSTGVNINNSDQPTNGALVVKIDTNKHIGHSGTQSEVGNVPALVAFQDNGALQDIGFRGTTVRFAAGNAERGRFTDDGLTFNGDTSSANALDDYEEGTWTPVYSPSGGASGVSYSAQVGDYVKIGRQVFVQFYMNYSASSSSGEVRISGLPFNPQNYGAGGVMMNNFNTDSSRWYVCHVSGNSNDYIYFYGTADSSAWDSLDADNSAALLGTIVYLAPS